MYVHFVGEAAQIAEGGHAVFEVNGRSIVVYNVGGEYYAFLNYCPHQGAEIAKGPVSGTNLASSVYDYHYGREGEIVRCPWHGWEFDLKTGAALARSDKRLRKYETLLDEGRLGIVIG